jgi:hypothetical protein
VISRVFVSILISAMMLGFGTFSGAVAGAAFDAVFSRADSRDVFTGAVVGLLLFVAFCVVNYARLGWW